MDCSKLSDFEINGMVASLTQRIGDHTQAKGKTFIHEHVDAGEIKQVCIGWKEFDPCNNPADAWPIIVENKISVLYEEATGKWNAGNAYWVDGVEWQVTDDVLDANPLRAAMIVFLMMQDKD